ncbi:MAG TPA: hypothetical protein VGI95_17485 [Caulobacteraceae bacterium]
MVGSISSGALLGWYQSFFGGSGTDPRAALNASSSSSSTATNPLVTQATPAVQYAPTAPWNENQPTQSQLVKKAMGGAAFFNPSAATLDLPGASADYKSLFALYSGVHTLYSIATEAENKNTTALQLSQLSTAFNAGMSQLQKYLGETSFSKLKLTAGTLQQSQTSTTATPQQATSYKTVPINTTGDASADVPAFDGPVQFTVSVKLGPNTTNVPVNLDDMGSTPRTMGNVVSFLNDQMQAAGVFVSFSSVAIAATPDTIQVGGKTITESPGNQSWALQLHTNPAETVTLSAPQTGAAVYIGQTVGNQSASTSPTGAKVAADAQSQLLKFNASGDGVTGPTTPANAASDQISGLTLGSNVNSIQSTALAPDGSVYVLANINKEADGTAPAGGQDVALQKYDSAGKLMFSSDLGSAASTSGLSLAVSADGSQVALAGQVTGSIVAGQTVNNPKGADSFVSVYDSEGNQAWTQQDDGALPNQATGVAFGADGSVYVTGQAQTSTAVQGSQGPSNSFLQVFSTKGVQIANTQIATGGSNTSSGIAVDGTNVYIAGVQNGDAVVTEYDLSNPKTPALVASRDLGSLGGGNVVGLAVQNGTVYVGGSARAGSLSAGAVTSAPTGSGLNAFAATLSTGLAPSGSDAVAYYGGAGDTHATALGVANGDVYLTGSVTGDLPGEPAIGAKDGFVAALNVSAGTVDFAQRFTGLDGQVAPTSIAVAPTGESVLDQLGLPQGVVDGPVSNLVTSTTSVKAGDSFKISINGGSPVTITVRASDTMASLATRIAQASGFRVNASTSPAANSKTALELKPASPTSVVTLIDGPKGTDALAALGLKPGVVADTKTKNGVTQLQSSGTPLYGLGLPASLDLSSSANIKTAQVQLAGAMSVIENAYSNLKNAATPAAVLALQKAQTSGTTPKYISNEIANYQSALTRLTAGQSNSSSSGLASLLG